MHRDELRDATWFRRGKQKKRDVREYVEDVENSARIDRRRENDMEVEETERLDKEKRM